MNQARATDFWRIRPNHHPASLAFYGALKSSIRLSACHSLFERWNETKLAYCVCVCVCAHCNLYTATVHQQTSRAYTATSEADFSSMSFNVEKRLQTSAKFHPVLSCPVLSKCKWWTCSIYQSRQMNLDKWLSNSTAAESHLRS